MRVGILGGGQLARMLALAGHPLGLHFRVLDPAEQPAAAAVASHVCGSFDDPVALDRFAAGLDVCTYESENIPLKTTSYIEQRLPLSPPAPALAQTGDRLAERELLRRLGLPIAPFATVDTLEDLPTALRQVGLPAVLKRRRHGYDGRGQRVLGSLCESELASAWREIGSDPAIVEQHVPFTRELALLAVRGRGGETASYPLVETRQRDGILRAAWAPAPALTPELQAQAEAYASRLLEELNYIGVLAVELFHVDGALIVNELAPRVHNSGHWTIEGAETSQFENHLRAIVGLPLGSTAAIGHTALINLLGTPPDPHSLLRVQDSHLHLYGKEPRPGRKVGHLTIRAADPAALAARLAALGAAMPEVKGDLLCEVV